MIRHIVFSMANSVSLADIEIVGPFRSVPDVRGVTVSSRGVLVRIGGMANSVPLADIGLVGVDYRKTPVIIANSSSDTSLSSPLARLAGEVEVTVTLPPQPEPALYAKAEYAVPHRMDRSIELLVKLMESGDSDWVQELVALLDLSPSHHKRVIRARKMFFKLRGALGIGRFRIISWFGMGKLLGFTRQCLSAYNHSRNDWFTLPYRLYSVLNVHCNVSSNSLSSASSHNWNTTDF